MGSSFQSGKALAEVNKLFLAFSQLCFADLPPLCALCFHCIQLLNNLFLISLLLFQLNYSPHQVISQPFQSDYRACGISHLDGVGMLQLLQCFALLLNLFPQPGKGGKILFCCCLHCFHIGLELINAAF